MYVRMDLIISFYSAKFANHQSRNLVIILANKINISLTYFCQYIPNRHPKVALLYDSLPVRTSDDVIDLLIL